MILLTIFNFSVQGLTYPRMKHSNSVGSGDANLPSISTSSISNSSNSTSNNSNSSKRTVLLSADSHCQVYSLKTAAGYCVFELKTPGAPRRIWMVRTRSLLIFKLNLFHKKYLYYCKILNMLCEQNTGKNFSANVLRQKIY